jgi:hypothetical protein
MQVPAGISTAVSSARTVPMSMPLGLPKTFSASQCRADGAGDEGQRQRHAAGLQPLGMTGQAVDAQRQAEAADGQEGHRREHVPDQVFVDRAAQVGHLPHLRQRQMQGAADRQADEQARRQPRHPHAQRSRQVVQDGRGQQLDGAHRRWQSRAAMVARTSSRTVAASAWPRARRRWARSAAGWSASRPHGSAEVVVDGDCGPMRPVDHLDRG